MKIICSYHGEILDKFHCENLQIDDVQELNPKIINTIKSIVCFRSDGKFDLEYGIGGWSGDEYYTIKSINFQNNDTEIIVKLSKKPKDSF